MPEHVQHPEHRARRRFRRHPCNRRIIVSVQQGESQGKLRGRCVTVSQGGLGAVIEGHLESNQPVLINFAENGHVVGVTLEARVRYNAGFHHGFEFIDPSQLGAARLRQLSEGNLSWL